MIYGDLPVHHPLALLRQLLHSVRNKYASGTVVSINGDNLILICVLIFLLNDPVSFFFSFFLLSQ